MNDHSNLPAEVQRRKTMGDMVIGHGVGAIVPQTFAEVWRFAEMISASGFAPYGMNTPEKCAVALMTGMELGLKPMQAIQSIAVINGRPTVWGDVAMAMIRATGLLEDFEEEYVGTPYEDDYTAVCRIKRKGEKVVERKFSVKQAKTAKLWMKKGGQNGDKDTPWVTFPDRMMMRRARSMACVDAFQDVLKGMVIAEDLQEVVDVTPNEAPQAPAAPAAERPRLTRGKKAQEQRGATPDQMEAEARVNGAVVLDEAHTANAEPPPAGAEEALEQIQKAPENEPEKTLEAADHRQDEQGSDEGDFADDQEIDWDEVKAHFKADLLACTDAGSCEAALEGVLARYDAIPSEVERILCESHDARVKQIAEAAQLRLAAQQKKEKAEATQQEPRQDDKPLGPKKTFGSTSEAEAAIEPLLSKMRQSKDSKQLQGIWDSHIVPFLAEYEVGSSDVQGMENIFGARMKILKRKEA